MPSNLVLHILGTLTRFYHQLLPPLYVHHRRRRQRRDSFAKALLIYKNLLVTVITPLNLVALGSHKVSQDPIYGQKKVPL